MDRRVTPPRRVPPPPPTWGPPPPCKQALSFFGNLMSHAFKIGTERNNFYNGFQKEFTGRVASQLLEKPDISAVGFSERNYDGKLSSVVVVYPPRCIVYDQMELASSIELTVAGAHHGLLTVATLTDCHLKDIECGKYQFVLVRPFISLMKKTPHRFNRVCSLHQTNYGGYTFE